ncbi:MAG: Phosphoribosylformylglycinamidine cyclo-ligase [Candidatus Saccharibacteria bacterium]|nr:Phosphoribosylformylglycinamidine cyclo-ligase [Candidatus Saccharibacteria bacterium]
MTNPLEYSKIVNYEEIDPFKIEASAAAVATAGNLAARGYFEMSGSRGESAFVVDKGDKYTVGVTEGLGTKNLVADAVDAANPDGESHYGAIAQDTFAMISNDLATTGAADTEFWAHVATGNNEWFADKKRTRALNLGFQAACNTVGATWAGGETPVLSGIIVPGAVELSGHIDGEIKPKERYVSGAELQDGDAIVLIESSGIHANGLSSARALADRLPQGYQTVLPDGETFGESLLVPTHLYSPFVQGMLDSGVEIHRQENITGHGWRKLMRSRQEFTYRMNELAPEVPLFSFMQSEMNVDNAEMYGNYNMGAGWAVYVPQTSVNGVISVAKEHGFTAWHAGNVEDGPKQVIIEPLKLAFTSETLKVRQ